MSITLNKCRNKVSWLIKKKIDGYSSSIWKTDNSEAVSLPAKTATDDLADLPLMDEATILTTLIKRYNSQLIYTNINDILVAVNPFTPLPIFGKSVSKQYHNHKHFQSSLTPHVYSVAEHALHAMLHTGLPQCCVIGGESGSGKTETCKHLVQHLLWNTGSGEANLITKLAQMNPLLEAFGNAQTVLNINSSRFAKFLTLSFSSAGKVLGGRMNEFLLEKSRVTNQQDGEMNFHIFYWMLAGITPEEASKCCLQDTKFRYLKSRTHDIQPALTSEFKAKFWEVKESLKFIGFSSEEVTCVLMILSAVLHMGNIIFSTNNNDDDDAVIANDDAVHKVCSLLRISEEDFRLSVVMEAITAKGEHVKKPLTPVQAREGVDSLAKALYSRLFSWIVNGINQMVQVPPDVDASERVIAVLDLFGFENLTENGFEQMCINIANEKLQSFYTQQVFDNELKDCESEGVPCVNVTAPGTQLVIDLFMEKNTGIFDLLDEESTFPKATDASLAAKLHSISGKAYPSVYKFPRYGGASFTVVHYAGMISYNLGGILKTNRDNLRISLSFLMRGSSSLVVKELFQSQINRTGSIAPSQRQRVSRHLKGAKSPMEFFRKLRLSKKDNQRAKDGKRSETTLKRAKNTLTYHFKNSLTELMTRIQNSKCHFVRCIKPNKDRTPLSACKEYIEVQLQYTGIVETVHIRKQGYALRALYSEFLALYPVLTSLALKEESIQITDSMEATEKILHKYGVRHYQIGTKKVFIQQSSVKYLDELETDALTMIIKMQSLVRRFLAQKKVQSLKTNHLMYAAYLESLAKDIGARQTKLLEAITGLVNQDKKNIEAKKNESEESHYINMIDEVLQDYLEPIEFTDLESPRGEDYNYIGVDDVFVDYLKKTNHEEPPTSPKDKRNVHPGHLKERKSRPPPPPIPHKPRSSLPSSPPIPSRSPLPPKTSSSSSSSPRPSALPPEPPLSPAPPLPSESNVAKPSSSSSPRPSAAPPEPPSSPAPPLPSDSNAAKPSSSPRPLASPPEPPSSPVPPLPPGSNAAKLTKPKEQSKLKKEGSQPSTPVDIEEMDPSEFPPSPREMYMYRPGQQVNGHNARSTSPSRGRSAPALPERKPETQLGNRTSLSRSSFSSRGSVSSEVLSPPPSPGYASHSHQDLYQSSTGTPQQIRKHQENKPFSYAVGINPKEAANLHSPREADMRVNKHERDLSPHGGRGNIRSEVSLNNADHQRFIHNEDLYSQQQNDAVIYQRIGGAGRDRLISAPEAGRQGYGQEFDSVANMGHSEGIYGQFVQPAANGGHHRPSLTYVPPPVVPNLQPDPGKMGKTSNRQQQQLQLQQQQLHQQQLQQQQLQQQQLQQQQLQQQQHHQHQQHQLQQEYQHQQNQYQQQQQLLQEQHQIHQHYQEHQHPQHHQQQQQQKAKPSSVPPPPPPPLRISSSLQSPTQQRQPRDLNPTPSGVRSPRSGSPARPAGTVLPHLQRQGSAATMDELAQVKLRTVSDSTTTSPSSPTTTTTGEVNSGAINVKLRPTKGKFSNIYAEEETTLPPPPPLDDIDELPPPPPPPELLGMGDDPHAHSLAFTSAPGNPYQSHVPPAPHPQPQPQPQLQQPHNQFPAGEGNSLQIHHQHQDRQNQHQQQQQHTAPSASSSSSSSFTPSPSCSTTQQVKKDSCGSHTLSGKVNSVSGSGAAAEVEENFTSGIVRAVLSIKHPMSQHSDHVLSVGHTV